MNGPLTPMPDRRKFIGGSDASAVLGINPWRTPLQLWQDKTTPAMPENNDPWRQRVLERGKRMEPYVVDLLAEETGLAITARNQRYVDPEFSFLACEIDAEAGAQNIEIKTVSPFKAAEWGELGTDAIPVHYTAQAQHGLMITGRVVCVFGVLIGGDDFRVYRVERDDDVIAAMRAREVQFWNENVVALVPPPAADAADLARLFPRDMGNSVEATTEALIALNELRELHVRAESLGAEISARKAVLQRCMGDAAALTVDGKTVATWRTQAARRFDLRALQEAQPAIYEQFIKTTESRVFRLK